MWQFLHHGRSFSNSVSVSKRFQNTRRRRGHESRALLRNLQPAGGVLVVSLSTDRAWDYWGGRESTDSEYKSGILVQIWSEMAPARYATRWRLPGGGRASTQTDLAHPPPSASTTTRLYRKYQFLLPRHNLKNTIQLNFSFIYL